MVTIMIYLCMYVLHVYGVRFDSFSSRIEYHFAFHSSWVRSIGASNLNITSKNTTHRSQEPNKAEMEIEVVL